VSAEWVKVAVKWAEVVSKLIHKLPLEKLHRKEVIAALFGVALIASYTGLIWALPPVQRFSGFIAILIVILLMFLVIVVSDQKKR